MTKFFARFASDESGATAIGDMFNALATSLNNNQPA